SCLLGLFETSRIGRFALVDAVGGDGRLDSGVGAPESIPPLQLDVLSYVSSAHLSESHRNTRHFCRLDLYHDVVVSVGNIEEAVAAVVRNDLPCNDAAGTGVEDQMERLRFRAAYLAVVNLEVPIQQVPAANLGKTLS